MSEMLEMIREKVGNKPAVMVEKISQNVNAEAIQQNASKYMQQGKAAAKMLLSRMNEAVRKYTA